MIPELIDIHDTIGHPVGNDEYDGYDDEQLARMGIDVNIIEIKTPPKKTYNYKWKAGEWPDMYPQEFNDQIYRNQYICYFMDDLYSDLDD